MHPLSLLLLLVAISFSHNITSQEEKRYEACTRPYGCGNIDVRYPFLVDDRPSYCGHTSLILACEGSRLKIVVDEVQYQVMNISYSDRLITLVDEDVLDQDRCPTSSFYRPITNSILELTPGNGPLIVLLTRCPHRPKQDFIRSMGSSNFSDMGFYEICSGDENSTDSNIGKDNFTSSYWGYENPSSPQMYSTTWARKLGCFNVVKVSLPAMGLYHLHRNPSTIRDVMKEGVEYRWRTREGWCNAGCEDRGGVCGFNQSYNREPTCFCPDGFSKSHLCSNVSSGMSSSESKHHGRERKHIVAISAGILSLFILVVISIILNRRSSLKISMGRLLHLRIKDKDDHHRVEIFLRNFGTLTLKRYKYYEIKKMTDAFKVKLGRGGCGEVFKGKLVDGRDVAVKVLIESKGIGEEFVNEVASIGRTYHVNIVTLLGFCSEGQRRALVYEFMSNGSLEKVIYNRKQEIINPTFGWDKLLQIAVGIARGLEYLHRGCSMSILHFDIKPHNILLDENYCPKISDFGLAKLCPNHETGTISMSVPRGTAGYIAPEVFCRNIGRVSYRSDVYSYGMMVLEMAGGRKNIDVHVDNTSEIYFPHWAFERIELNESLGLENVMSFEEEEIARKMIMIGLWCIQTEPGRRPSMSKVLEMLEGEVDSIEMPPTPFPSSSP